MNRKQNRRQPPALHPSEILSAMTVDEAELAPAKDGDLANAHDDPEDAGIFLAACRIVASGYKTEISRSQDGSLFVQAAYQLLRRFLERQFAAHSRAA